MGNGLASAAHLDHRRQRLIVQPAFRREHLRGYAAVMRQEITAAMARWHDGAHVDLVDEMFTLTTTMALRNLCLGWSCRSLSRHAKKMASYIAVRPIGATRFRARLSTPRSPVQFWSSSG